MLGQPEQVAKAGKAEHGDHIEREDRGYGIAHVSLVGFNNGVRGGDGRGPTYSRAHPNEDVHVTAEVQGPPCPPGHAEGDNQSTEQDRQRPFSGRHDLSSRQPRDRGQLSKPATPPCSKRPTQGAGVRRGGRQAGHDDAGDDGKDGRTDKRARDHRARWRPRRSRPRPPHPAPAPPTAVAATRAGRPGPLRSASAAAVQGGTGVHGPGSCGSSLSSMDEGTAAWNHCSPWHVLRFTYGSASTAARPGRPGPARHGERAGLHKCRRGLRTA